jgi:hypothetical protein
MRTICEVVQERDEQGDDNEILYTKGIYYLLHFGLMYDIIEGTPVNYTVVYCESKNTGHIEAFNPTQLRILGVEK